MNFTTQESPYYVAAYHPLSTKVDVRMYPYPYPYTEILPGAGLVNFQDVPFALPPPAPTAQEVLTTPPRPLSSVARTSPSVSATRRNGRDQQTQRQRRVTIHGIPIPPNYGKLTGPTNFQHVPQIPFTSIGLSEDSIIDTNFIHPPIEFQMKGFPETGVRIEKILHDRSMPAIVDADDPVMGIESLSQVKLKLIWPGYEHRPFEKRMSTHSGKISRGTVLLVIAQMFTEFARVILREKVEVNPGSENWKIVKNSQVEHGVQGPELFITALVHRGGANWQAEFWAPKFRSVNSCLHATA
ncbi:hypothetical protein BDN72DRAFT_562259 [Pluteus cervinus]|uniref:Uncharacterized protein n=1 Tax=Pluteus cervinus TaxID=181527 RepID=A0ACD3BAK7_9AGAR|nr:hypothetical protein BDN72DRAFT_562259 [Pluteus cervinus]